MEAVHSCTSLDQAFVPLEYTRWARIASMSQTLPSQVTMTPSEPSGAKLATLFRLVGVLTLTPSACHSTTPRA